MKLFLASSFEKTASIFEQKLQTSLKGKKVIFISNAADNHTGDKWWVNSDRDAFNKHNAVIIETDLRTIPKDDFDNLLNTSDIIHFCGGSILYTISLIKEKGFDTLIADYVKNDKIIYSGTSAGSMIVAKDLSLEMFDPEEKPYVANMKDLSGLGLTNFIIMPHSNNADFMEGNVEIIKLLSKYSQPVIFIYDNQAVWVEDDKFEIVSLN
ncbi:MAG: Type 1 glutamine amidotransferase-like domain-containing protein [Minisyncoccia bacterium]